MNAKVNLNTEWKDVIPVVKKENLINKEQMQASIDLLKSRVKDPEIGLFGPESMLWRIFGDQLNSVASLAAVALQTAHPYIAHGVHQKSAYQSDALGRARRTFKALNTWVYSDLDSAIAMAWRIWRVHSRISGEIANDVGRFKKGDPYDALEEHSVMWVHYTVVRLALQAYEAIHGKLTPEEGKQFNEDTKLYALLFGLREELLPPTYNDFLEYYDIMLESGVIVPDQASRDIMQYYFDGGLVGHTALGHFLRIIGTGFLPKSVQKGYEVPWGAKEKLIFTSTINGLRVGKYALPKPPQHTRPYRRALHRVNNTQAGFLERTLDKTMEKNINLVGGSN